MLSCDQVLAELEQYLDDEGAARLRAELAGHIAECKTCRAIYDTTRRTLVIITDSGTFELPESLASRVLEKLRRGRGDRQD
jgi:anti-sigma factor (TIGR02949 family)